MDLEPLFEHAPVLAIAMPLFFAFILPGLSLFTGRRFWGLLTSLGMGISLIMSALTFLNLSLLPERIQLYKLGGWIPPVGIVLEVDRFNALVGILVAFSLLMIAIYSMGYTSRDYGVQYYYILLLIMGAGLMGCVYTGDLFNLFVFLEVATISSYGLIAFRKDDRISLEGSLKYLMMSSLGINVYLLALAFLYNTYGTLNMADLAAKIHGGMSAGSPLSGAIDAFGFPKDYSLSALAIISLAIWTFGIKGSIAPLHFPHVDAAQASPASIGAMFSGVLSAVSLYALMRFLLTLYGGAPMPTAALVGAFLLLMLLLGFISMLVGAFMALVQTDLKRLLAFSTVANVGYVAFAIGLLAQERSWPLTGAGLLPIDAAILHIVNHTIVKVLLFLCAGGVYFLTGSQSLDDLGGIGRVKPSLAAALAIGGLAIAGVPGLNCFVSKWLLIAAALDKGGVVNYLGIVVVVISSAAMLAAYLRIIYAMFSGIPRKGLISGSIPASIMAPILILTALAIILGVYPQAILGYVRGASEAVASPAYWEYVWEVVRIK
jgi:multicomponent Na+:H+ antiporter subunit D